MYVLMHVYYIYLGNLSHILIIPTTLSPAVHSYSISTNPTGYNVCADAHIYYIYLGNLSHILIIPTTLSPAVHSYSISTNPTGYNVCADACIFPFSHK